MGLGVAGIIMKLVIMGHSLKFPAKHKKNLSGPKGKPLCHPCCLLGHGSARSQLVSSTNPALSTIAASVLNDKAGMTIFQRYFPIYFHDETGACDLCQDHFHRPS